MAKEISRKRITLHPLKEDGTTDTSINLYPKTFIDGIVDRDGEQVEVPTKEELNSGLESKQDILVSGTNIKTINNESIIGSGNISAGGTKLYKYTGYISKNSSYPSDATSYSFISNIYDEDLIGTKQLTSELAHKLDTIKSSDLLGHKVDLYSVGNTSTIISFTTFDLNISAYLRTDTYKTEFKNDGTVENTIATYVYSYESGSYLFFAKIEEL